MSLSILPSFQSNVPLLIFCLFHLYRQDSYKVICEVLGQLLQATGTLLSPDAGTQADFMPQMSPSEAQDAVSPSALTHTAEQAYGVHF